MLVRTIPNFEASKLAFIHMNKDIYIRPDHEVMIWASWKTDELAKLDMV